MATGSGIDAQVGYSDEVYTNEVQSLPMSGTPTGGGVILGVDGAQTAQIAFNANAAAAQAIFDALPQGAGQVVIGGGPWPGTALTVTFSGSNMAKRDQPLITLVTNSLTGGSAPTVTPAVTTPGTGYGDYVAPSRFTEHVDVAVSAVVPRIESKARRAGQKVGTRSDRSIANKTGVAGDLSIEGVTKGLGFFLNHMFGAFATSTPLGGTLTRDHTFTFGDYWNKSFTMQAGIPMAADIPAVQPFTWVGCKIPSWEISCDVDGVLELKLQIDGKDEDTSRPLAATAYPSGLELLTYVGGYITLDGRNYDVSKFSMSKAANLATDRRFARRSTLKREPIMNAGADPSITIDSEFRDMWAYNKFISGAPVALVAVFEGPTVIEASYKPMLQITCPTVRFDDAKVDLKGTDVVTQNIPMRVLQPADGSQPVTAVYRTTDATP